jgi:hypothetical protein
MIVKVVIPDALYNRVYFARGEQGPQGVQGEVGPIGPQGPQGIQGVSYTPGDPIYVTVTNKTGNSMAKGTIVYTSGGNGTHTQVSPALASGDLTSARTLGWLSQTLDNNQTGLCMVEGYLDGINTQGITDGSQLYLSPTVPGGFTATKPSAPEHMVYVGVSVKASAGDGRVYVKVQNGYELDELHDVAISAPVDNQVLTYESSTGLWKNKANPADGVTSITATSPLTGGTITSTGSIGLDQSLLSLAQSQITGLVTALAGKANLAGGNALTGAQTITSTSAGEFPLSIISASGQTASTFRVRNSANNADLMSIDSSGQIRTSTVLNPNSFNNSRIQLQNTGVFIDTGVAANVPLAVRGAVSQTANLQVWQDSSGNVLNRISSSGDMVYGRFSGSGFSTNTGSATIITNNSAVVPMTVKGAASQTANLQEWQNSAGTVIGSVSASGAPTFNNFLNINNANTGIAQQGVYRIRFDGSNTAIGSQTPSAGGGVGVIPIQSATTVPSSNPTGGGILYVDAGALKYRGTSGTVTTIANA